MAAKSPDGQPIDLAENRRRMAAGELYYAFTPDLVEDRRRAAAGVRKFNDAVEPTRRELCQLWQTLSRDETPLPPKAATEEEDEAQFDHLPWIDGPLKKVDYGYNVKLGVNTYLNAGAVLVDTCTISIGDRTLVGPNCSFYSGAHPFDPVLRNGTKGPETGKPITIAEDCWLGGGVHVLPGVTVGRGAIIGAGSVVTKDVEPMTIVAGNPAKLIRRIEVAKSDP